MSDRQNPNTRPVPPIQQTPKVNPPAPVAGTGQGSLGDAKHIVQRPVPVPTTPSGPL